MDQSEEDITIGSNQMLPARHEQIKIHDYGNRDIMLSLMESKYLPTIAPNGRQRKQGGIRHMLPRKAYISQSKKIRSLERQKIDSSTQIKVEVNHKRTRNDLNLQSASQPDRLMSLRSSGFNSMRNLGNLTNRKPSEQRAYLELKPVDLFNQQDFLDRSREVIKEQTTSHVLRVNPVGQFTLSPTVQLTSWFHT